MSSDTSSCSAKVDSQQVLLAELRKIQQQIASTSWADVTDDIEPSAASLVTQSVSRSQLTAVPLLSAMAQNPFGSNRRRSKQKKSRKYERHSLLGNDQSPPWMPRQSLRDTIVKVVISNPTSDALVTSTTVPVFQSYGLDVSGLQHLSSYTTIFDEYMMFEIECLIEPQVSETVANGVALGSLISAVDVDDAAAPTSYSDLLAYSSAIQSRGTQSHYHRWRPSAAVAAYSGVFTSFANVSGLWIDAASTGVKHYGLKLAAQPAPTTQTWTIQFRFHVWWRTLH
jgi:hypothetical protein